MRDRWLDPTTAPAEPMPREAWHPTSRALHDAVDAATQRLGASTLHPDALSIVPDLLCTDEMRAWQEGKAERSFLGDACWSEQRTVYARYGTDPARVLIRQVKALYDAPAAVVTDCGAQAVALLLDALLKPGGHAILARQIYGKTRVCLEYYAQRMGIEVTVVDHLDAQALNTHARPDTCVAIGETYTNPLTRAIDPDALGAASAALQAGRSPHLRVILDDTIATPWGLREPLLSRPGIDAIYGAGTKALAGQDLDTFGYVVSKRIPLMNLVMDVQAMRGGTLSWRAAEVISAGLDAAERRFRTRCASASTVAAYLASHPEVADVFHPSLPDHVDREVVDRAYALPGSLLSFRANDLDEEGTAHLCDVIAMTGLIRYALSFDGLVSKVNHHQVVSEFFTPPPRLRRQGIDRLVRIAVGTEDATDLCAALNWALTHHRRLSAEDVAAWRAERTADLGLPTTT